MTDERLAESRKLQEEAARLADVLWAGRDDDTARLLREGVKAMAERDYLRVRTGKDTEMSMEPEEKPADPTVEVKVRGPHGETVFQVPREALEGSPIADELRARDEALAAKAGAATQAEERALADFTAALEEVRGKLCRAVSAPEGTDWRALVPIVEAMADGHHEDKMNLEDAEQERAAVVIATRVLADQVVEADRIIRSIMGAPSPQEDPQYASDFVDQARAVKTWVDERTIAYGKAQDRWEDEKGKLCATIENLEDDIRVLREGDETLAASWKGHVWDIAVSLGVPRPMMGQAQNPNVDQISRYIGQVVMPMLRLQGRIEAVEKQLQEQEMTTPPDPVVETLKSLGPDEVKCPHCETVYPRGVFFCPRCGKGPDDPKSAPEKVCETCEGMPDDCFPDPPGSGYCESYKPKE